MCTDQLQLDLGKASSGFGTITIAVAAAALTAFVLLMTLGHASQNGKRASQPLILLPLVFLLGLLAAFMFSIISGSTNCQSGGAELLWASIPFALSVVTLLLALTWIVIFFPHYPEGVLRALRVTFGLTVLVVSLFVNAVVTVMRSAVQGIKLANPILDPWLLVLIGGPAIAAIGLAIEARGHPKDRGVTYRLEPNWFFLLVLPIALASLLATSWFADIALLPLHSHVAVPAWVQVAVRAALGSIFTAETLLLPRTFLGPSASTGPRGPAERGRRPAGSDTETLPLAASVIALGLTQWLVRRGRSRQHSGRTREARRHRRR